jgi:hypothetical protein
VDRPLGYPLGAAVNDELQKGIVMAALELLLRPVEKPLLVDFAGKEWDDYRGLPASAGYFSFRA